MDLIPLHYYLFTVNRLKKNLTFVIERGACVVPFSRQLSLFFTKNQLAITSQSIKLNVRANGVSRMDIPRWR